jgi:hypothetical protein
MKVKDLIRALMDKEPNDDVSIKVKAKLYANDKHVYSLERQVEVDDVKDGGWPVVLTADLTVSVESKFEIF